MKALHEDERAAIRAAHPLRTTRYDLYNEAMRLVGERHAKGDLVDLVNWLLSRVDASEVKLRAYELQHEFVGKPDELLRRADKAAAEAETLRIENADLREALDEWHKQSLAFEALETIAQDAVRISTSAQSTTEKGR